MYRKLGSTGYPRALCSGCHAAALKLDEYGQSWVIRKRVIVTKKVDGVRSLVRRCGTATVTQRKERREKSA